VKESTRQAWLRTEARWMRFWLPVQGFFAATGRAISVLFSWEGLVPWGYILLVMSLWFGWIRTPFYGGLSATKLSVLPARLRWDSPRTLLSFGVVVLALLLYAWLTRPGARWARWAPRWFRRPYGFHAAAGLGLACLGFWFFLTTAFLRPDLLETLIEQTAEFHRIKQFDNAYIQGNVGVVRIPYLSSDTLWDQMDTLVTNLGMGYWYALLGSGCLLTAGVRDLIRGNRSATEPAAQGRPPMALGVAASVALILLLVAAVLAGQSLTADVLRVRADTMSARGDYAGAFRIYRRARNIDHRLAINEAFLEKMGRAAYRSGDRRSPEANFYLSHHYRWAYAYANADYHIQLAIEQLREAGRTRTLPAYLQFREKVHVYWGRSLYENNRFQGALARWHEALRLDPDSFELPFYLAHAYYQADGTDQHRAIELNKGLLARVRDRILRSDLFCNLGEAYYRQKDYAEARIMYEESLDMYNFVKDINYRAQRGMLGLGS